MKSDAIVIGAGAAGMMCALQAGQRGRSVVLLDHVRKPAEKLRISGGGRCNFTNLNAHPEHYLSGNPHFCRSALARYTPQHFLALLQQHRLTYHEKKLGQLFCDQQSTAIIAMLQQECEAAGVKRLMGCEIDEIKYAPRMHAEATPAEILDEVPQVETLPAGQIPLFHVRTSRGEFNADALVVATGGLSISKTGATPFGYRIAEQFGMPVTRLKPGLVPLTFAPSDWQPYAGLAGLSLDVVVSCKPSAPSFRESMLFTHRGLSGPAILQISSYWQQGEPLHIDLLPDCDIHAELAAYKSGKKLLSNFLARWLPKHFAETWCRLVLPFENKPMNQYNDKQLQQVEALLHDWQLTPSGTEGYNKAEVTCGGVDTHALSSKTMECIEVPGLYFIGEVVDVTGHLGGYNLQWAWASGYAAGQAV